MAGCSTRFRRFIDVQLQTLTQTASEQCPLDRAALALTAPRRGMWAIRGGAQALADLLAVSLKQSGGSLRFERSGTAACVWVRRIANRVDLLSGERVNATRAIVSN